MPHDRQRTTADLRGLIKGVRGRADGFALQLVRTSSSPGSDSAVSIGPTSRLLITKAHVGHKPPVV